MNDMPRPRPPYLLRQVTQHDRVCWYVRKGKGKRIRVPAPGTDGFNEAYQAAIAGLPALQRKEIGTETGTLAWLVERYRETTAWTDLSMASRRQRENIFEHVLEKAGRQPFAKITTANIMAGRDRRAKTTPAQARKFLDTMRGLFRWALKAGLVKADPTAGVANPSAPNSDGFTPWSREEIATYEARWPIGTRQRVWLDVLVYTGLRRGDAVCFGRQHIRNGVGTIKTEKTDTVVTLPVLPALVTTLDAGPCGDLTFIAGENGRPLTKESFGNLFRKACREAGLQNRSAHGLRKAAATRAAEKGATVAQLNAIFGWKGAKMATHYTETADRRKLSLDAMHLLANDK